MQLLSLFKITLSVAALACAAPVSAQLRYSGSDTVEPVVDAARIAFLRSAPGFKMAMASSGSSVGLRDLCGGRSALAGSSRQIKPEETKECERNGITATEVPVAMDAVVLIVSNKNTHVKDLKLSDLTRIFEPAATGKIMSWKAVHAEYPETPLKAVGVNIKHGTFEFFQSAIGAGKFIRSDYKDTTQHDETAKIVAADPGAIGYVPLSVAKDFAASVRMVSIDFGKGPVEPSTQNVVSGRYTALSRVVYLYMDGNAIAKLGGDSEAFVKVLVSGLEKFAGFANMIALNAPQYQETIRRVNLKK